MWATRGTNTPWWVKIKAAAFFHTNVRDFFPGLPIIVRANDLSHVHHLENRGATQAVPEALEASLQLGANAMTAIGVRPDEIMEVIQELRDDDYAILNKVTKN